MEKITIELLNANAINLLKQLEKLKILRVVQSEDQSIAKKQKWAGRISKKTASEMLKYVE